VAHHRDRLGRRDSLFLSWIVPFSKLIREPLAVGITGIVWTSGHQLISRCYRQISRSAAVGYFYRSFSFSAFETTRWFHPLSRCRHGKFVRIRFSLLRNRAIALRIVISTILPRCHPVFFFARRALDTGYENVSFVSPKHRRWLPQPTAAAFQQLPFHEFQLCGFDLYPAHRPFRPSEPLVLSRW